MTPQSKTGKQISSEQTDLVEANTAVQSPPLCPEIRLRLLTEDAPLRQAAGAGLFADDGPRPYWAFCWASGQVLARYLLDHPQSVRNRRVFDFGCGSGIAAIAAAMAGAAEVTAADRDPLAAVATEINARLNRVPVTLQTEDTTTAEAACWDVLLAADVCYIAANHDWLLSLASQGRTILLADPGRPALDPDKWEELSRHAVRTFPDLEDPELTEAVAYRFRAG